MLDFGINSYYYNFFFVHTLTRASSVLTRKIVLVLVSKLNLSGFAPKLMLLHALLFIIERT